MQIDLSAVEIKALVEALEDNAKPENFELWERLDQIKREAAELEGMDFSDCGDACKL